MDLRNPTAIILMMSWFHALPIHILHDTKLFTQYLDDTDWIRLACCSKSMCQLFHPWIEPLLRDPIIRLCIVLQKDFQYIQRCVSQCSRPGGKIPYVSLQFWPACTPTLYVNILYHKARSKHVRFIVYDDNTQTFMVLNHAPTRDFFLPFSETVGVSSMYKLVVRNVEINPRRLAALHFCNEKERMLIA